MRISKHFYLVAIALISVSVIAGCITPASPIQILMPTSVSPSSTPITNPSATPDLCSKENLAAASQKVITSTKNFDDITQMAQYTPKEQLAVVILEMRSIRRDADEQSFPKCMADVQEAQIIYMTSVINAMTFVMNGLTWAQLQKQIEYSNFLRVKYEENLAKTSGIPYSTPTPIPPTPVVPTSTAAPVTVKATQDTYVLDGPGISYQVVAPFPKNQTGNIVGRTRNSDWLQIEIWDSPGKPVWVPRQQVYVTGSLDTIPIVETQPSK